MIKIVNISDRVITIDGVKLNPSQTHVFNNLTPYATKQVKSLVNVGLVKKYRVDTEATTTTKRTRK